MSSEKENIESGYVQIEQRTVCCERRAESGALSSAPHQHHRGALLWRLVQRVRRRLNLRERRVAAASARLVCFGGVILE